jgi:hypothetical protein
MSYVYKLLKLRLYAYKIDEKYFKNKYKFHSDIYKDFDKISTNKIEKIIDTIEHNIVSHHTILQKYSYITEFINSYQNKFSDCVDVILDEYENYKNGICDEKFLLDIGFDNNILNLEFAVLQVLYNNFKIMLNNNLSAEHIKYNINKNYPQKSPIYNTHMFLLQLYISCNSNNNIIINKSPQLSYDALSRYLMVDII